LRGHIDHVHQVPGKRLIRCPSQLLLRELLVHYRHDQWQVRQRREIDNQKRRLQDEFHIKFFRLRDFLVRSHHHHLSAVHSHSFFRVTFRVERADPFEDHEFCGRTGRQKSGAAHNGNSNGCSGGLDWGSSTRHRQKDRAARQIYFTSPRFKTENRVCAKPRNSEIGESQFGARFHACADGSLQCDFIIHHSGTRRAMCFQQSHVLNYLGHACFLQ
jgi:hypothetical protein